MHDPHLWAVRSPLRGYVVIWYETMREEMLFSVLKGIYPEFQVIRGFSQKIPAGLLSYDQIHN